MPTTTAPATTTQNENFKLTEWMNEKPFLQYNIIHPHSIHHSAFGFELKSKKKTNANPIKLF